MIDLSELIHQKPEEKVVLLARSHWILFIGEMLLLSVLGTLPVGMFYLFAHVWPALLLGPITRPILILCTSAFYLMWWLSFIVHFIDYYLDVYLVTTDRMLDVAQKGMFRRTVSELDLARVQDVTSEIKGVLRTLLNFGDVYVQTAGERERFVFEDVPRPDAIRKQLLDLVEKDRIRQGEAMMS